MIRLLGISDLELFWPIIRERWPGMVDKLDALSIFRTENPYWAIFGDPAVPAFVRFLHYRITDTAPHPLAGQLATQATDFYGPKGGGLRDPATIQLWQRKVLPVMDYGLQQLARVFPVVGQRPAWGHVDADLAAGLISSFAPHTYIPPGYEPRPGANGIIVADRLADIAALRPR